MNQDAWNPQQYERFKDQRSQAFFDLMALVGRTEGPRVADLGCGTGELTAELHRHLDAKETIGVDSSEAMLAKAKAYQTNHLKFEQGEIEKWQPEDGL